MKYFAAKFVIFQFQNKNTNSESILKCLVGLFSVGTNTTINGIDKYLLKDQATKISL